MRVLHLWRSDGFRQGGGGAVSMRRIHANLRTHGIDSRILCEGRPEGAEVSTVPPLSWLDRRLRAVTAPLGLNDVHRLSSFRIARLPAFREADLVHVHGLHSGFVNYLALPALTRHKPVVFTLRDMWAFTGHCAYTRGCERWRSGCGRCPHLDAPPAVRHDATRLEWRLKNWTYRRSGDLTVVGISRWIRDLARDSMLGRFPIHYIPNGVDVEAFRPYGQADARAALGVPQDRLVIMFASVDVDDVRKGGDLLLAALQQLPETLRARLFLLLLGSRGEKLAAALGKLPHQALGEVTDAKRKALAYSAADVFAFPSRQDAFGNVALESMACGTPVVASDSGGIAEAVRSGETGYLAAAASAEDFGHGLQRLLADPAARARMGRAARRLIVDEYSADLEVHRYMDLYRRVIAARRARDATAVDADAHHGRLSRFL